MENLVADVFLLALLFSAVSLAYSSVGLGGGSSYTALMALFGVSHVYIPTISLTLNVLVTTVGSFNFIRKKHGRIGLILPFFVTSIPMSYIGGTLSLPKEIFYWILLGSLFFVALRIYCWKNTSIALDIGKAQKIVLSLISGAVLGLIAGIVGIGGGIYLVPLIIILGLGSEKEAAACGSVFIWFNSISGLAARLRHHPLDIPDMFPLIVAVLLGSAMGSHLGSSKLSAGTMEKVLGGIIIVAIFSLTMKVI
jgi:uncharacterized membrane protein YfcA